MINQLELRKTIKSLLGDIHYQVAPNDTPMPYVVFDLPTSSTVDTVEIITLDIDIWGSVDTSSIDSKAMTIDASLDKFAGRVDGKAITIFRETRHAMPDDDKSIKRVRMTYSIKVYG